MADPLVVDDPTATDLMSGGMRRVQFSQLGGPEVLEMVPLQLPPLQ